MVVKAKADEKLIGFSVYNNETGHPSQDIYTGGEHVYTNFCPNCGAHMNREVLKAWKRLRD